MKKQELRLPTIIPDNDREYIILLEALVSHADPQASLRVEPTLAQGLSIFIIPSQGDFKEDLIRNILGMHRNLGIKTSFSKSTEIQRMIIFQVNFAS